MFEKIKNNFWITVLLASILIIVGYSTSNCISTQSQVTLDKMSEEDFNFLLAELEILSRMGTRQVIAQHPDLKKSIDTVIRQANEVLFSKNIVDINKLAEKLLNGLDPDMQDALKLAIIEIQKRGGFTYIDIDGQKVLSPRSINLLKVILHGVESAL